jgi:hypothetical protein
MATATSKNPATTAATTPTKERKPPKSLMVRIDEQLTRAVIARRVTVEEIAKLETRISKLKGFLE